MVAYPQVILFGSIAGEWREKRIIPVLKELGVTYFNPNTGGIWTIENGDQEADLLAHCETIVMVFNNTSPSFAGLAEAGWAAMGAMVRGQHCILLIDLEYSYELAHSLRSSEDGQALAKQMDHWTKSTRHLVYKHAKQFDIKTLYVAENMADVIARLRLIYGDKSSSTQ